VRATLERGSYARLLAPKRGDRHVPDDHGTVADAELGTVVLADPYPLDEAERIRPPRDGLADVWIDQHRDHWRCS
jgi:hypothetical protein